MFTKKEFDLIKLMNKLEDIELRIDYANQLRQRDGEKLFKKTIDTIEGQKAVVMNEIEKNYGLCQTEFMKLSSSELLNTLAKIQVQIENTNQLKQSSNPVVPQFVEYKLSFWEKRKNLASIELFKKEISTLGLVPLAEKLQFIKGKIINAAQINAMDDIVFPALFENKLDIWEMRKKLVLEQIEDRQDFLNSSLRQLATSLENNKRYSGKMAPNRVQENILLIRNSIVAVKNELEDYVAASKPQVSTATANTISI